MAGARATPLPSGYDDVFVNAVEEDLLCAICHLPLKEAVQTGNCGHRFCRLCLNEHFRRLELNREPLNCPVDRNRLIRRRDIFSDKATERKILSFIIKCPSEGCQWSGELRSKTNHLASCSLKIVSCTNDNCSETMTRNNLQKHVTTTCRWRILRCNFCSASHPECKKEAHLADCKKFPLRCSQNCGAFILREKISTHIKEECPLTIISCPYEHIGCTAKIQRKNVEPHVQTSVEDHLDLACVKLSDGQKKFEETTRKLTKLEERVNHLEKNIQCSEECCNSFTWRISNFREVLRKAISGEKTDIESTPFYRSGYKCKLHMNPNEDGSEDEDEDEDTYLSIYIIIMKGEYDAALTWPFQKKVIFTLIDQQENANNRENIVVSLTGTSGPESCESFARPVTDQNIGWGFGNFVSHEKLGERRYIVDDTIFIQVRITSPALMHY